MLSALEEKNIIPERKPEQSFGIPVKAAMPKEKKRTEATRRIAGGDFNVKLNIKQKDYFSRDAFVLFNRRLKESIPSNKTG